MVKPSGLKALLSRAEKALFLGVGGGNDSVTLLILREELERSYGLKAAQVDIAAMLPDFLEYSGYCETGMTNVREVTHQTQRSMQGVRVAGFPEPLLAKNSARFGIGHVWGLDMRAGTEGIAIAMGSLVSSQGYDMIIACDVGGDFIAVQENYEVLSPMMDAYALYGLRGLAASNPMVPLIGAVFGLGTDGESSPEMLRRALRSVGEYEEGAFPQDIAGDIEAFYREEIEPNRYSRTADFTLQEIRRAAVHSSVENYRVRYHSRPEPKRRRSYTGNFDQTHCPDYYGKYYLFTDFSGIANPFAVACNNAVEWVLQVTSSVAGRERIHHEMVGQQVLYNGAKLLCSIPSRKFSSDQIAAIFNDTAASIRNGVYEGALVYSEDVAAYGAEYSFDLTVVAANPYVSLLRRHDNTLTVTL